MFFDGSSKRNPRVAGAGGVILSLEDQLEISYAWNLGEATNNQAQACTLFKCLNLAKDRGISSLSVIGYSRLILSYLIHNKAPSNLTLNSILNRIRQEIHSFVGTNFFNVARSLNSQADFQANLVVSLPEGLLHSNGLSCLHSIP